MSQEQAQEPRRVQITCPACGCDYESVAARYDGDMMHATPCPKCGLGPGFFMVQEEAKR